MKAEFDVKLTEKDLYNFNIYQIYRSSQGIVSILLALIVWIMAAVSFYSGQISHGFMYIIGGIVFLFYIPLSLKARVKRTMSSNEVLSGVLHYEVTPEAINVTQGDENAQLPWNLVYKVVANGKRILIYSNRVNAYIIPRAQIGTEYETFLELARKQLEKYRLVIK